MADGVFSFGIVGTDLPGAGSAAEADDCDFSASRCFEAGVSTLTKSSVFSSSFPMLMKA